MSTLIPPPGPFENNSSYTIEEWIEELENFVLAALGDDVNNNRKKAVLLTTIGDAAKKVISNMEAPKKDTFEHLKDELIEHYQNKRNAIIERHLFNTMVQEPGELIESFVTRLRTQAAKCKFKIESIHVPAAGGNPAQEIRFKDLTDEAIRDRIVVGITDQATRARLLRQKDLTLEAAMDIVKC